MEIVQEIAFQDLSKIVATKRFAQEIFVDVPWEEDKAHGVKSTQDFLWQDIDGKIGQAHHDKACSLDNNIVVVFQNGRMVNYKVEELRLGLEEEKEQSHDDDDHGISLAVARGMCSKTYAEKKIASHAGFKTPNDEEDYDQRTTLQTPAAFKDSLVKKERQGGILQSNIATDSTLNSSSSNNHCLAALSRAEVGTHKSIPIAFLDAYMKDEGPAIDSNVGP